MGRAVHSEHGDLVLRKVCRLIEPFNTDSIGLTRETNIASDLAIDSVAVLDLIMEVEDTYDISLAMHLVAELETIGDLVDAIHQTKRGQDELVG